MNMAQDQDASESPEGQRLPNGNIQNQLGQYMAQQDAEGEDEEGDEDDGQMEEMDDQDEDEEEME